MSRIDGIVSFEGTVRGKRKLVVKNDETQQEEEHLIPTGKHIIVQPGDVVHKGQHLTEGSADPHEIIEIIIRQMLRKVHITDPGATENFWGEQVDRAMFLAENKRIEDAGGKPAEA